jgi:hypothetical protein|tara:strand:+ start:355 stop:549 length:195 start_codon:yes stop_codon:yes gene_type:complete
MGKEMYYEEKLDWIGNGTIKEMYEEDGDIIGRDVKLGWFNTNITEKRISKKNYQKLMGSKKLLE